MENFTKCSNNLYQNRQMQGFLSNYQLSQKRENYRVKIRNHQIKIKMSEKRQSILKTLKSINIQILHHLKTEKQNIPLKQLQQLIYQLQQGYDDPEFYLKLNQLKLQKVLLTYLTKLELIKAKISLINSLNQLLYYSNQSIQIFIQQNAIDFLYKQLKHYSFLKQQENQYLDGVLTLIRNLTSILNKQFNLYLQDIDFLQMVTKKIIKEGGGRQIGNTIFKKQKQILKIRTNIIKTQNSNKQKILRESLKQLYQQNILYSRHYISFLQCLIAIFQIQDQNNQNQIDFKRNLFNQIECLALQVIQNSYFDQGRLNQKETICLLKFLIMIYEDFQNQLFHIGFYIDKQFFIRCLNNKQTCKYAIRMLKIHNFLKKIQDIFENFNDTEQKIKFYLLIINLMCQKINNSNLQKNCIEVLHTIIFEAIQSHKFYMQILIQENLLEKLEELLQKQNQNFQIIIKILQIVQNIVDYILKKQNDNWIVKILISRGFFKIIEYFQLHSSTKIAQLSIKILEKYNLKSQQT